MKSFLLVFAGVLLGISVVCSQNTSYLQPDELSSSGKSEQISCGANTEQVTDSIAHLKDLVRQGDSLAYKALADKYRHGANGLEKSFINALCLYEMAGINVDSLLKEATRVNPNEEMVFMLNIMEELPKWDEEKIKVVIKESGYETSGWAQVLLKLTTGKNGNPCKFIYYELDNCTTGDELISMIGAAYFLCPSSFKECVFKIQSELSEKCPYYNNLLGQKCLKSVKGPMDKDTLREALNYFSRALKAGCLTPDNAKRVLSLKKIEAERVEALFSDEEIIEMTVLSKRSRLIKPETPV